MVSHATALLPQAITQANLIQQTGIHAHAEHQPQGMSSSPTGTTLAEHQHQLQQTTTLPQNVDESSRMQSQPLNDEQAPHHEDLHLIAYPTLTREVTCYTDASLTPNNLSPNSRNAGLGVFITNTQTHPMQMICIKAMMESAVSVLMAEAAALALSALVTDALGFQLVTFLCDNQQLVCFLNAQDQTNPPD